MLRKFKSFDSNLSLISKVPEKIDKKNFIIFVLLYLHYEKDEQKIKNILYSLYMKGIFSMQDIEEFKTFSPLVIDSMKKEIKTIENTNTITHLVKQGLIGEGSFGKVYSAFHELDKQYYAIKEIVLENMDKDEMEECFQEVQNLAKLHHPNIIRYFSSVLQGNVISIQMELCSKNLVSVLYSDEEISLLKKKKICCQILQGLNYLHGKNMVHLDLKPDNILFDKEENVKITDFSFARQLSSQISTDCVAMNLYSPRNIHQVNFFIDIYAFGVIVLEIFLPFCQTFHEKSEKITNCLKEQDFSQFQEIPHLETFLKECFSNNASSTKNLLNHNFFKKVLKN